MHLTRIARRHAPASRRDERGVALVLVALLMVAILLIVALVIDFGFVRATRQDSKRDADVAVTAGLQALAADGIPRPWRGVCQAFAYLKANQPDRTFEATYTNGATPPVEVTGDPCATGAPSQSLVCTPNAPSTWAVLTATSESEVVTIKSGYALPDTNFPEDATTYANGDLGDPDEGSCDQLAVIVDQTTDAYFGGVAGRSSYDTIIRSVGRVTIGVEGQGVPAFLMLERNRCDVLSNSVGGSELGIVVRQATAAQPGIIHADSSGTSNCTLNTNAGGYVVFGSPLPGGGPSITAEAAGIQPGIIAIRAVGVGGRGGATATGLSVAPTPANIVSRKPVDDKYNSAGEPTITNLHAAARSAVNLTAAQATTAGYTVLGCGDTNGESVATRIFVDCASYSPQAVVFSAATEVVFSGSVSIGNGQGLFLPSAQRVFMRAALSVANGGQFAVNHNRAFETANTPAGVAAACNGREGPAWTTTSRLVIFGGDATNGALDVTGRAALCQTTVLLAGPSGQAYSAQQITNGSYDPSCTATQPCPRWSATTPQNGAGNGFFSIAGFVQWSAPNQSNTQPATGSVGLEDLALWSETAGRSEIKSGGVLRARGVYFQPNADNEFRSPAAAFPQDAQFIARRLVLLQGTLEMRPTVGNVVTIPVLQGIALVR